jgi:glycogen(starch) synthase
MRIHVISPWYPRPATAPYSGVFVKKQVDALARLGHEVTVEVPEIFPAPAGDIPSVVYESMEALARRSIEAVYPRIGNAFMVPTPVPSRSSALGRGRAMASSIELHRRLEPIGSDITHAHLGLPTGWAALEVADGRPVVVTEHQSTLDSVLADAESRDGYARVINDASVFLCVSPSLRDQLIRTLGAWVEERVSVLSNIVDLGHITFSKRDTPLFRDWVYVGGLFAHKGVESLLRTFAMYRQRYDRAATLTIVGDGPMRSWARAFSVAKGMNQAVHLVGAVDHTRVGPYLASADVMVHLSPSETFGIASLEAIGAGLPVVSLRNGGADSAWGDYESVCGLLLDPSKTNAQIARAIADLRESPGQLDPEKGRRMVEERFSPETIASRLLGYYSVALR